MITLDLNGKWRMKNVSEASWTDAMVPGDMYNDLLVNNKIEDPFYRENEWDALKLSYEDYEYERTFSINSDILENNKILLCCDGLDTLSQIKINGTIIANTNNMHRKYEFSIKDYLVLGENKIHVTFFSPAKYVEEKYEENPICYGKDSLQGIYSLRKSHCMFGWDWGPMLPDVGIWRNIYLEAYNEEKITDVYITQRHCDNKVKLNLQITKDIIEATSRNLVITVTDPKGNEIKESIVSQNEVENVEVEVVNPMLWWPNGYGEQHLYTVNISVESNDCVLHEKSLRIGLRTMEVRQEEDKWGESFEVVINNVPLFLMGANYIPEDNLLARCSKERTSTLLVDCVKANFNCIRVWGGGYYQEDYFYDLCDELGLVVWQDMMFACRLYPLNDEFEENLKEEFTYNIRRLRHHASIALWCGNNEIEWSIDETWLPDGEEIRKDYFKLFNNILPAIVQNEDPERFYWPASPTSKADFVNPNDDNYGDMHYWGVWHNTEPFTYYRKYYPRFMSEFGLQSFPSLKTVETFTLEEDRNIFSPVMENHQKNKSCNRKILHYISENFRFPKDFESLLTLSQLIQAEGIKYGVEHWRRNRGRCMGAIYWQLNDCWPVASWSSIDYFGRWKALHYASKRFYAPILISANEEGTEAELHVTNETFNAVSGLVRWTLRDNKGNIIQEGCKDTTVEKLSSSLIITLDFKDYLDSTEKMRNTYLEYEFISKNAILSSGTVLFVKAKHFNFIKPKFTVNCSETDNQFVITLETNAFSKSVYLDFEDNDCIFEDNYFDLSPNTIKTITVEKDTLKNSTSLEKLRESLQIKSLVDTF